MISNILGLNAQLQCKWLAEHIACEVREGNLDKPSGGIIEQAAEQETF